MTRRRRFQGDDGFVLVIGALVLVALLAMSAFAVDLGGLYNARRQDQSAADVAALAGVQEMPIRSVAASEAIAFAEDTLGVGAGTLDFNSCATDPGALTHRIAGADCLSVNRTGTQLRVRVPDQELPTFFAHLVGIDSFTHSAFAIAELRTAGFGNVLPFGIPSLGSGGGYICPATPPSGLATAPCAGATFGNFGYLNLGFYETGECNQGGGSGRFGQNLAMGADHPIERYDGVHRFEFTLCPDVPATGGPNVMLTETGNIAGSVAEGMVAGPGNPAVTYVDGQYGRLARLSGELFDGPAAPASAATTSIGARTVDDNPLWNFIPATLSGDVPDSCQRSNFVDAAGAPRTDLSGVVPNFANAADRQTFSNLLDTALGSKSDAEIMIALLDRCFSHYLGEEWGGDYGITQGEPSTCSGVCTGPVFSVDSSETDSPDLWDLQYTSRFGYVPEFPVGCSPTGTGQCPIERFRAIYIQQNCMGQGSGNCDPFDPGFGQTWGSVPNSIAGVTMWAFPDSMLPAGLGGPDAPNEFDINRFAALVR